MARAATTIAMKETKLPEPMIKMRQLWIMRSRPQQHLMKQPAIFAAAPTRALVLLLSTVTHVLLRCRLRRSGPSATFNPPFLYPAVFCFFVFRCFFVFVLCFCLVFFCQRHAHVAQQLCHPYTPPLAQHPRPLCRPRRSPTFVPCFPLLLFLPSPCYCYLRCKRRR